MVEGLSEDKPVEASQRPELFHRRSGRIDHVCKASPVGKLEQYFCILKVYCVGLQMWRSGPG